MFDQAAQHSIDNVVAVDDSRGNAPESRVDKRHVTGGATYVYRRHAQTAADFRRTGFGQRQNHRPGTAGRLTNGDRPFSRQRFHVSKRHPGHEVADGLRSVELSVPLLPFLGQGEFHVVSADDVFKGPGLHFHDEGAERFREQIQVRLFPSFGFFEDIPPRGSGRQAHRPQGV